MTEKKSDPFDISDVVGNKPPPVQSPKPQSFNKSPLQTIKPVGINLAIPVGKRFKSVDLATCTNEEFIMWLSFVYPMEKDFTDKEVNSVGQRTDILKRMEFFHSRLIFAHKPKDLANN